MERLEHLRTAATARWQQRIDSERLVIYVGSASCGRAAGALETLQALRDWLEAHDLPAEIIEVGCIGPCYLEPLVDIAQPGKPRISFAQVTAGKVPNLLESVLLKDELPRQLVKGHFGDAAFSQTSGLGEFFDLPMLKPQKRIILKNCGMIDPQDFDAALAAGAYRGLQMAMEKGAEWAIEQIKEAGLRGRGGAGFPTWRKWDMVRRMQATPKYVVCNADEGDPGAFMNRSLIEGDPHRVLEGMLSAGFCSGAGNGLIYVRAEYPLAVERLRTACAQLREAGFLGRDILGSGFNFEIEIREGAGAFVCGEETALIASLEGQRGTPRPRPPFPADRGYKQQPTLINNTETYATIPAILCEGGEWYRQFGTPTNPGTKTFSLVGKARYTGLIEIPLGMTLRQVVEEIGGGTRLPFKGIQTGGPLGGCLPAEKLDTPITYETMRELGSIMGSGGLIVMDDSTCMVDMARFFIGFARNESCGNCTPCRNGTRILSDTLESLAAGEGGLEDLDVLRRGSDTMTRTSLCGLGQAAANPIVSTLEYFADEYRAHAEEGFCPAGVCHDLFELRVNAETCTGCDLCRRVCAFNAISGGKREIHWIDTLICTKCKACVKVCAPRAIHPVPVGSQARELAAQPARSVDA